MEINGYSISIIMPVFNVESFIGSCLESIMSQTYTNVECIIIDDCGTDKSIEIAKSVVSNYDGDIEFKFLKNDVNSGISVSRNSGIKASKGDYLFFIDSDDKLFPDSLQILIDKVKAYPGVDLVQGNCESEDHNDPRADLLYIKKDTFPEYICDKTLIQQTMLHWSFPTTVWNKLIKRSCIVDNGLFFMEGVVHEDEHWKWLIQKYVSNLVIVNDCTYWYRTVSPGSIMNTPDLTRSVFSRIKIFEFIALHGTSIYDISFAVHFLPYQVKILRWDKIKNLDMVNDQLIKSIEVLKSNGVDVKYIRNLQLLRLPIWLLDNKIFAKLYSEYEKRNNLVYSLPKISN